MGIRDKLQRLRDGNESDTERKIKERRKRWKREARRERVQQALARARAVAESVEAGDGGRIPTTPEDDNSFSRMFNAAFMGGPIEDASLEGATSPEDVHRFAGSGPGAGMTVDKMAVPGGVNLYGDGDGDRDPDRGEADEMGGMGLDGWRIRGGGLFGDGGSE